VDLIGALGELAKDKKLAEILRGFRLL